MSAGIYVGGEHFTDMLMGITPQPRTMYNSAASALGNTPPAANIVTTGPHWTAANVAAIQALCPAATVLNITDLQGAGTTSSGVAYTDCDIFDCEIGLGYTTITDAINAAVQWLADHQAAHPGQLGCVYLYHGNLAAFLAAAQAAGVTCFLWVADQTNVLHSYVYAPGYPAGFKQVATQWSGTTTPISGVNCNTVPDPLWLVNYS
jgi:hypothetical protein